MIYTDAHPDEIGSRVARQWAKMSGCRKVQVGAAIIDPVDNTVLGVGNNDIAHTIGYCPRSAKGCKSGEGYEDCRKICGQGHHAEDAAITDALRCFPAKALAGCVMYLWGHSYACDHCSMLMESVGIEVVAIPLDPDTGALACITE